MGPTHYIGLRKTAACIWFFPFSSLLKLQMTQYFVYIKLHEDLCKNGFKFRATIFVLVL